MGVERQPTKVVGKIDGGRKGVNVIAGKGMTRGRSYIDLEPGRCEASEQVWMLRTRVDSMFELEDEHLSVILFGSELQIDLL